jgi:HK97 family phage major capsid protein
MPTSSLAHVPTRFELDAPAEGAEPAGPVMVTALALPWGATVALNWFGDTVAFDRGSVDLSGDAGRVKFLRDHIAAGSHLMGVVTDWADRPDGLHAAVAIPREELADPETGRALRHMRSGLRDGVSVRVEWDDDGETVTPIPGSRFGTHHQVHAGARIVELSSVVLPRFDDARLTGVAASRDPDELPDDEPDDEPDDDELVDEPGEDTMTDTVTASVDPDELARADAHRRTLAATVNGGPPPARRGSRHPSVGAFAYAVAAGQVSADERAQVANTLAAALVDETTADIAGLVPDAWLRNVVQLVAANMPTVEAFSRLPLPDTGMTVHIPVVTVLPTIALQAAEKGQIASGKTTVVGTPYPVRTFAGGEDVSIQAITRSDPSYLSLLMNGYAVVMAQQIEAAVAAAVVAAAPAGPTWPAGQADMADPFVDVAAAMLGALGRMPDVAVVSTDTWAHMAKIKDTTGRYLFPTLGPVNAPGTSDITSTSGAVHGLTYYVSPALASSTAIVGVREAFVTMLGSPIVLGPVDNVAQAGRDVGLAVMGAFGATDTRGLSKITGTLPVPSAAARASK